LRQTPWTLGATIKCTHIMAHKWAKKSKEFGFHHYQKCFPHVLDEWESNLYKIQEDIIVKFGGEIIEKNTCWRIMGSKRWISNSCFSTKPCVKHNDFKIYDFFFFALCFKGTLCVKISHYLHQTIFFGGVLCEGNIGGTICVKILNYLCQTRYCLGVICEKSFIHTLLLPIYTYLSHPKFNYNFCIKFWYFIFI